jgi:hypothetical protein
MVIIRVVSIIILVHELIVTASLWRPLLPTNPKFKILFTWVECG